MSHRPAALTEWRIFAKGRNGRWWMLGEPYQTKTEANANMVRFWGNPMVVAPVGVEPCECVDSDYLESQL